MTDAPEGVWIELDGDDILIHNNKPNLLELISTGLLLEYIRKEVSDALVAAAYEDAAKTCERAAYSPAYPQSDAIELGCLRSRDFIRHRTPTDARAALDRIRQEAREEAREDAFREAADTAKGIEKPRQLRRCRQHSA